ncbi:MAG: primase [Candidatus Methanomethylophilaceae archaeon]|nr:primase [Candidatus Methanomethylophilaceae archaeon]
MEMIQMYADPTATKYLVKAKINADGVVEKPDVVGAIFGQTEGLLGDDLDLRDLQKTGRIGRIEVDVTSKGGRSEGNITMSSSLDQVETAILASALETVDRVGPCKAFIKVIGIEDVRITKREKVIERAKELLSELIKQSKGTSSDLTDNIRKSLQVEEIVSYGKDRCPAGPNVKDAEAIIVVEGRSDVLNCLRAGIKNAIAVEGTDIPKTVQELSKERVVTAFVDGDRGGELILKELFQVAEVDFVARAPRAQEVEELTQKQLVKCLRNKIPADQYMEMNGITVEEPKEKEEEREKEEDPRPPRREQHSNHDRHQNPNQNQNARSRDDDHAPRKERFNTEAADRFKKKEVREEPEAAEEPEAEQVKENVKPEITKQEAVKNEGARTEAAKPEIEEKDDAETDEKPTRTLRAKRPRRTDKALTEDQIFFRDMLADMASTHNAKLLDAEKNIVKEIAVKSLADTLKEEGEGIASIVFDGVISQRIVDVCDEKKIGVVVATRKGKVSKLPADMTLWAKDDLY